MGVQKVWEVVGGGTQGGILVREGKETNSAQAPSRLATGSVVAQLALEGERLQFKRLTGSGPDSGWVSVKLKDKALVTEVDVWQVVGGSDKGGVLVREGKEKTSKEAASRLSTGAMVKQVALEGERLNYEQLSGTGPDKGWVSTKINGKDLLVQGYDPELGGAAEAEPLSAPELSAEDKAELAQPYEGWISDYLRRLKAGEVGPAPGPPERGADDVPDLAFEERRKVAVANSNEDRFGAASFVYPPWKRLTKPQMEKAAKEMLDGNLYGLPVPPTLSHVQKLGTSWLTSAFHAAGTLPKDNAVKSMKMKRLKTTTKDAAGGAGPKAFLFIEYEKEDPDLHKELFVKMPWATEGSKEMGGDMGWRYTTSSAGDMEFQECVVYRFLGPVLPVKIPKYYFADCCRDNTNYILITEKVNYGSNDQKSFKPYEILPSPQKYWDWMLPKQHQVDMYCSLVRAQARMAAWYQNGFFSNIPAECIGENMKLPSWDKVLPSFPLKQSEKARQSKAKAGGSMFKYLEELLTLGQHVFPAGLSNPAFLEAMKNVIQEGFAYADDIKAYDCLWPQQIGLTHTNLNCDNAFYWRDDDGRMDCGLIDFGGAGPVNIMMGFSGGFSGSEPWLQDEYDVTMLKVFKDEYYRECGIRLNLGEMERSWHFRYINYLIYLTMNIEVEIFAQLPRSEWKNLKSLNESRMHDKWTLRTYSDIARISCEYCYRRWRKGGCKRIHLHDTLIEFKQYWEANGME